MQVGCGADGIAGSVRARAIASRNLTAHTNPVILPPCPPQQAHLQVLHPHRSTVPRQAPPVPAVLAVGAQGGAPRGIPLQPLLQRLLGPAGGEGG